MKKKPKLPLTNDQRDQLKDRYETDGKIAAIRLVLDWFPRDFGLATAKLFVEDLAYKNGWRQA